MLLFELLNNPVQTHPQENSDTKKTFTFKLPDGRTYYVMFAHSDMTESGIEIWEVSFRDLNDKRSRRYEPTQKGSELVIFSTVMQLMTQFLEQHPQHVLEFSAEENNRRSLYERMLKRYIKPPMTYVRDVAYFYIGHQDSIDEMLDY